MMGTSRRIKQPLDAPLQGIIMNLGSIPSLNVFSQLMIRINEVGTIVWAEFLHLSSSCYACEYDSVSFHQHHDT